MTDKDRLKELYNAMHDLKEFDRRGKWPGNKTPQWVLIDIKKGYNVFQAIHRKRRQAIEVFCDLVELKLKEDKKEMIDMTYKKCEKCKKGKYVETNLLDDRDGVLHCNKCRHEVKRWRISK